MPSQSLWKTSENAFSDRAKNGEKISTKKIFFWIEKSQNKKIEILVKIKFLVKFFGLYIFFEWSQISWKTPENAFSDRAGNGEKISMTKNIFLDRKISKQKI